MPPSRINREGRGAAMPEAAMAGFSASISRNAGRFFVRVSSEFRPQKEALIHGAFNSLQDRLVKQEGLIFGSREQAILKLKLARYFQREDSVDINTLSDAIVETSDFISTEKGGLHRLLKVHEQKTLQAIAEIRKQRVISTNY